MFSPNIHGLKAILNGFTEIVNKSKRKSNELWFN